MLDIFGVVKEFFKYIAPLAIVAFGVLFIWGLTKWFDRFMDAIFGLSKHPAKLILAIIFISALLYFWFQFLAPLFE